MQRLPREQAMEKCLEVEKKRLEAKTKDELIQMLLRREESYLEDLSYASLANRTAILTDGKFSCERPDIKDTED